MAVSEFTSKLYVNQIWLDCLSAPVQANLCNKTKKKKNAANILRFVKSRSSFKYTQLFAKAMHGVYTIHRFDAVSTKNYVQFTLSI